MFGLLKIYFSDINFDNALLICFILFFFYFFYFLFFWGDMTGTLNFDREHLHFWTAPFQTHLFYCTLERWHPIVLMSESKCSAVQWYSEIEGCTVCHEDEDDMIKRSQTWNKSFAFFFQQKNLLFLTNIIFCKSLYLKKKKHVPQSQRSWMLVSCGQSNNPFFFCLFVCFLFFALHNTMGMKIMAFRQWKISKKSRK